jgi:hypothetical protein
VERKPFITLEQLTWEQKKYLAIETARVAKLREVVQEYRAVCDAVAFDDVVGFCNAYQPDRPSSAMLIPFSSGADGVRHQRRAPQEQCEDRLRTFLDRFHKREDRINRSAASLLATQESERERVVQQLMRTEERGNTAIDSRLEHVRTMGIASRGRSELWRTQRSRHDRVETFRRMVTREGLQRRLDEVACVQQGMKDAVVQFQHQVRRQNLTDAMQRESQHTAVMRRARELYRETKK